VVLAALISAPPKPSLALAAEKHRGVPAMRYRFVTADVFTDQPFGGNPLAVLPDARGLDDALMQKIAREFNLSETVFVLPPASPAHTRRLRIFTPMTEIPFAGHPTVGTALALARLGELPLQGAITRIVFEEGAGPVPVTIAARDGHATFAELSAPQAPELLADRPPALVASALSLMPSDLVAEQGLPRVVSCGLPFLLVRLADRQALARARLNRSVWERQLAGSPAQHLFLFAVTDDGAEPYAVRARVFAPGGGVDEDPATGSAAAALGGWLGSTSPLADGTIRCVIAQGLEIGRPSRLEVEVDKRAGAVTAVRVGGAAVLISEGTIEAPAAGAWTETPAAMLAEAAK
jgi:trans-2,3-dihydro-3-hydroxyanthranilate isomerase